ncbi:MAG: extracellular solute-binding protein [Enterocloster sp.]
MKKRKFMAGTLACAIAGSLVGCMPTQTAPADTKQEETSTAAAADLKVNTTDPITLRMNWWGGDNRHKATLEAIRAFEKKYPNIKVEAEYESFTGHEEKVALALKSGSAADVIQLNMDWVFNYSPEGGMFTDLNSLSNVIDLTAYDKTDLDFFTTNGDASGASGQQYRSCILLE